MSGKVLAQVWDLTAQIWDEDSKTNTASSETNAADSVKNADSERMVPGRGATSYLNVRSSMGREFGHHLGYHLTLVDIPTCVKLPAFGVFDIF